MNENELKILEQEVGRITNEIQRKKEELERLELIKDVLQMKIEIYQPKNNNDEFIF